MGSRDSALGFMRHRAAPARGGVTAASEALPPARPLLSGPCRVTSRGPRPPDWPPPPPVSPGRRPGPAHRSGAAAVPAHSLLGSPCARSSADVPGSPPSPRDQTRPPPPPPRPSRASPRGREQRTAPAAMRGECGPGPRPARAPAFSAHSLPAIPLPPSQPRSLPHRLGRARTWLPRPAAAFRVPGFRRRVT